MASNNYVAPALSSRMERSLKELLPGLAAAAPPARYDATTTSAIDLSSAQNEVLRPELLDLFKQFVAADVTSTVFALPSPNGGNPQLRAGLASFFNTYFHPVHAVKPEHIVLTAGASDAIESVVHAVCDDGDSVLVPGPSWHGFTPMLKNRAGVNIIVAQPPTYAHWDNYLVASLQAVYDFSAEKERIKAVLLCNPHNPLSGCYSKRQLLELMEFCQEHGLHLIVDEIYALTDLNDTPEDAPPFVSALSLTEPLVRSGAVKVDPSRVHVVWGASKLFGMSGFRMGCIITQQNTHLITALTHLTTSHASQISTSYLTSLLTSSALPTLLLLNSTRLTTSYTLIASFLSKRNIEFITPTHGLFLFARIAKHAQTADEEKALYDALAAQTGVLVGQGRLYDGVKGSFGWARIRFSVSEEVMRDALSRMEKFLNGREKN